MSALIGNLVPVAVLSASLLGSAHCAGMCGGLAISRSTTARDGVAFHLGRLSGYLVLGALAGSAGQRIFNPAVGVWASWVASLSMAAIFLVLAYRSWYGRSPHIRWLPTACYPRLFRGRSAGVSGMLTALMPCGWLQSFVISAIATRSPLAGGAFLFAFWLGTLPALVFLPLVSQAVLRPLKDGSPRLVALLLVAAGLGSLGLRWRHLPSAATGESKQMRGCGHHRVDNTRSSGRN